MSGLDSSSKGAAAAGSRDPLSSTGGSSGLVSSSSGSNSVDYAALGRESFNSMGIATMMSERLYTERFALLANLVGARSSADKRNLEVALTYYFSVHGTSPDARWSEYDKDFVFQSVAYQPMRLVQIIGEGSLKQFCARYTHHVTNLYRESEEFRRALVERASRLGLSPDEGVYVVDFYGKDASIGSASMGVKSDVRNRALQYRANNADGVSTQKRERDVAERASNVPVVATGLNRGFTRGGGFA